MVKVFQPDGMLDGIQAAQLRQQIDEVVTSGINTILIDLQQVNFMDSSGLGILVAALKTVRANGGRLFVCSINDQVKMLFELTSLDRVFEICSDQKEFYNQVY